MERIAESHSLASFESNEQTQSYIEYSKKSSEIRYGRFFSTIKKLDIKGNYLDIGSGPGLLTQSVAELYPEVQITGTDISKEMVDFALSDRKENLKSRLNYAIGDACKLETLVELGKFNLIYSIFTMHHWDKAKLGIENLYSMLNTGGILYIYDLKRVWWLYYVQSKSGFFKSIKASYRTKEIEAMLKELGINNYTLRTIFPPFMIELIIEKK